MNIIYEMFTETSSKILCKETEREKKGSIEEKRKENMRMNSVLLLIQ